MWDGNVGPDGLTLAKRQQFAGRNAACLVPERGNEPATMAEDVPPPPTSGDAKRISHLPFAG
jgi:hypothetical protein